MNPQELAKMFNVLTKVDAVSLAKESLSVKGAINNGPNEILKDENYTVRLSTVVKVCDNTDQVMVHLNRAFELSYNPSGIEDLQAMVDKFFTGASAQLQGAIVFIQGAANLLSFNYKTWMSPNGVVETNSKYDIYNLLVARGFAENA